MIGRAAALFGGIALAIAACAPVAASCPVTPFSFSRPDSTLRAGNQVARFDNPDGPAPSAWEGPVAMLGPGGAPRCTVRTQGLIAGPLFVYGGRYLVLATFSGSNHQVETIDMRDCSLDYSSAKLSGPITARDGVPLAAGRAVDGFRCAATP